MKPVTDPVLLAQLNADSGLKPVTDPVILAQLNNNQTKPESNGSSTFAQNIGNLVAGAVRGAGSIGSTIIAPYDMAKDAIAGKGLSLESNRARRAAIDGGLREMGANTDSTLYSVGKIGGEIAGTAGAGGVIAKGLQAVSQAPKAVALANAIRTGGMTTGLPKAATIGGRTADMATRIAGGGITGGAMGAMVDPENSGTSALIGGALPPAIKAAGMIGSGIRKSVSAVGRHTLGASTGVGADSISAAYQAGKNKSTSFLDNMRGNTSFNDVVDEAKSGLQKMRIDRGNEYRSGMVDISNDKSVIPFKPITDAVAKVSSMGSYKGQQINKNAAGTVNELSDAVSNWASLNPAEYHTPEGLDALKQAIGDIRDGTQFGTAARRSADTVYNAVKDQITSQAPTYAKVMKDYSEASTALSEVEKALSLGNNAAKDTAIRKLQSLMRNNAQTSYGNRLDIAKNLENKGGVNILPAIAGQSMNSAMPRGMVGALTKGGAMIGAIGTSGASIPLTLAAAPFTSPRLMGEALYGAGRLSGSIGNIAGISRNSVSQLAKKNPGLLDARDAMYRSLPLLTTSANQKGRQ